MFIKLKAKRFKRLERKKETLQEQINYFHHQWIESEDKPIGTYYYKMMIKLMIKKCKFNERLVKILNR